MPRPSAAIALVALLAATGAAAQDGAAPSTDLRRVETEMEAARARQAELAAKARETAAALEDLRRRSIAAAQEIDAQQAALEDLGQELAALAAEAETREARLAESRERLRRLLGGLTRLARLPPEALLVRPQAPIDAVRSALLLQAAIPAIEHETGQLRTELAALSDIRRDLLRHREEAETARRRLAEETATLDAVMAERESLLAETTAAQRAEEGRLASLAERAADLRDLIERLAADRRARAEAARAEAARLEAERQQQAAAEAARAEAERLRAEAEARAEAERQLAAVPRANLVDGVLLPASGDVVLRYGQKDRFGAPSRGVTVDARPGSPVVAPIDGTVRFAGVFRGYGRILLLEHTGGYHSMISGLDRIGVRVGQDVLAGEPVGTVPQNGQNQQSLIYFEFRRAGQPVNPIEGMAQALRRGRG